MPAKKVPAQPAVTEGAPAGGYAPEADFDDTIAHNRAVPILDAGKVPRPPKEYRATDPDTRTRRLRRVAADHRSEAADALREAGGRDMTADLGRHAPDSKRAPVLLERLTQTGALVTAAQALLTYAREMDQIALSDAFVFLEKANKELVHTLDHEPNLAIHYAALQKLFAARSDAIAEGMARAKDQAAPDAAKPAGK